MDTNQKKNPTDRPPLHTSPPTITRLSKAKTPIGPLSLHSFVTSRARGSSGVHTGWPALLSTSKQLMPSLVSPVVRLASFQRTTTLAAASAAATAPSSSFLLLSPRRLLRKTTTATNQYLPNRRISHRHCRAGCQARPPCLARASPLLRTTDTDLKRSLQAIAKPPVERNRSQAKPSQAKPSQAKPNQTKPSQTKPNQTKPNQTTPPSERARPDAVRTLASLCLRVFNAGVYYSRQKYVYVDIQRRLKPVIHCLG